MQCKNCHKFVLLLIFFFSPIFMFSVGETCHDLSGQAELPYLDDRARQTVFYISIVFTHNNLPFCYIFSCHQRIFFDSTCFITAMYSCECLTALWSTKIHIFVK